MTKPSTGPLAGVRVIDLSTVVLGAYATQILGDLGADVIKIEVGDGDIMRGAGPAPSPGLGPIFVSLNRNKRSAVLDLKTASGLDAIRRLVAKSDLFFTNVRMDGLKRLGLAYDDIRTVKPDIIYLHCTGYSADGPHAGKPAYDDLIQAVAGATDLSVIRDGGAPSYLPTLVADKVSGLHAVYAALAGLYARAMNGEGQFIEAPMLETFTAFNLVENLFGHTFIPPLTQPGYTRSTSRNRRPFATKDGYLGALPNTDRQWIKFFELGGRPEIMATDPRFKDFTSRTANIDALYALAGEVALTRTTDEWLALLHEADIPAMKCNTLLDVIDEPHLRATGFLHERQHPAAGPYVAMKHPVKFSRTPADIRREAPSLGEHTREVLAELGYTAGEIDAMLAPAEAPAREFAAQRGK